jgi:uncharacterized protein
MRSFIWFAGLIAVGFAVIAVTAYPAYLLVHPHFGFPFHRVASRVGYLFLAASLYPLLRHLRLANRRALGYELPRRQFLHEVLVALGLGIATMLPVVLIMGSLGLIEAQPDLGTGALFWLKLALKGVLTGLAVSLGEETFTRGAMYSGIARDSGARLAVLLTSLVYASLHFVGKVRLEERTVGPASGLEWVSSSLHAFAHPLAIGDAFLALAAVGMLLGLVRTLTGNIAACIGLHAGWVSVITMLRQTSQPDRASALSWLLSDFDGVVGWLVLAWTLLIGVLIWRLYARRARGRTAASAEAGALSPPLAG